VFLVLLFLALLSGCSQAAPFHRAPDRHTLAVTPHLLFPDLRGWMADPPTMIPAARTRGRF